MALYGKHKAVFYLKQTQNVLLCLDHVEVDRVIGVKDPDVSNVLFAARNVVTRLDVHTTIVRGLVNPEHTVELVVVIQ